MSLNTGLDKYYKISLKRIDEQIVDGKTKDLYYEEFDFMFSEKK